ncbi:protein Dok-7 [Protopterus annectens]|uniref:protein Dok-7 n=1 Tax=Protopterus annectens TaxID=7888 RepID=UPI001CFC05EE|nr:protein Dok-7 [Protopterus annectens]
MTDSVVVEGHVKLRDGKKWKSRWLVLRKPSPVADCLVMLVYKDKSEKNKGHKERSSITLQDICGLEPGLPYEGLNNTLAIICLNQVVMVGFEHKDVMMRWDIWIRYSLGEVHRFHITVLPGTQLESGQATVHFCNNILVIVRDIPPVIIGQWRLSDLRRYGAVPNGFVFEGGTRCGFWAGVFFLACAEGEQISFLFDCIVRGISPTKGPFGIRPSLPAFDTGSSIMSAEERVAHETMELEKRLSLLSHSSCQSSGGDDRSISSSSSDTSHSDTSIGSRLTIWPEPSLASTSLEGHGLTATKTTHPGDEILYPEAMRGSRPQPKPQRTRNLQEIGRQSSSDSGIATGSHSSYSGSFSSYAGSLDMSRSEEFGSWFNSQLNIASEQNLCTCQPSESQRASTYEYQVPNSVRHLYDTPRSVLQTAAKGIPDKSSDSAQSKDQTLAPQDISEMKVAAEEIQGKGRQVSASHEGTKDSSDETYVDFVPRWQVIAKAQSQTEESQGTSLAPPSGILADTCEICSPQPGITKSLFSSCPICGGLKGTTVTQPGVLHVPSATGASSSMAGGAAAAMKLQRGTSIHSEVPGMDRTRSEAGTYVNIPVSPTSKKQLHYMELEHQEPSMAIRGEGSSKYVQIDIAATETAHKVGTQHAQFREERLHELEQKKKGAQQ